MFSAQFLIFKGYFPTLSALVFTAALEGGGASASVLCTFVLGACCFVTGDL